MGTSSASAETECALDMGEATIRRPDQPKAEAASLGYKTSGGRNLHTVTPHKWLARLRFQLPLGFFVSVLLPLWLYDLQNPGIVLNNQSGINTAVGGALAFLVALYLFRRAITFPGVGLLSHVMPAVVATYGIVVVVCFGLRLDYSRLSFASSFLLATFFFFGVGAYLRQQRGQCIYVVPSASTIGLGEIADVEWVFLKEAALPGDPAPVLVADLRADLGADWERAIAEAAVAGHSVYHIKQIKESLTGRVEIEHLSENSFGSLIPHLGYGKLKRLGDLISALLLLPLLLIPGVVIVLLIKIESPGPVFFRQKRRGYRGEIFEVVKFRTMVHRFDGQSEASDTTHEAITLAGDARVTRLGRLLRRTRIDELPQIWNVLRGEMSWIGPRPEALSLSEWYMDELPFYTYRHIVRPGITGWAQVNQGHVADLSEVLEKLHYDFYYIKNFSAWLDLFILARTIGIVMSGFGAK